MGAMLARFTEPEGVVEAHHWWNWDVTKQNAFHVVTESFDLLARSFADLGKQLGMNKDRRIDSDGFMQLSKTISDGSHLARSQGSLVLVGSVTGPNIEVVNNAACTEELAALRVKERYP